MNLNYSQINLINLQNMIVSAIACKEKGIYFLLQETMLFQRNIYDITAEKMLHWQSFPKKEDALRE